MNIKKQNYSLYKYNENFNSNLTYKLFPLTSTNTKNINNKKNEKIKNKTKI